jgi:hypothetical protein
MSSANRARCRKATLSRAPFVTPVFPLCVHPIEMSLKNGKSIKVLDLTQCTQIMHRAAESQAQGMIRAAAGLRRPFG